MFRETEGKRIIGCRLTFNCWPGTRWTLFLVVWSLEKYTDRGGGGPIKAGMPVVPLCVAVDLWMAEQRGCPASCFVCVINERHGVDADGSFGPGGGGPGQEPEDGLVGYRVPCVCLHVRPVYIVKMTFPKLNKVDKFISSPFL